MASSDIQATNWAVLVKEDGSVVLAFTLAELTEHGVDSDVLSMDMEAADARKVGEALIESADIAQDTEGTS